MSTLDEILEGVAGYLHGSEPEFLSRLAFGVPKEHCIVEVGSFRGRSTIALAWGANDWAMVYAIDPHHKHMVKDLAFGMDDHVAFLENILRAGVADKIRIINTSSMEAFQGWALVKRQDIGLIFIDGAHDYLSVKTDVEEWSRWLVIGGKLAIHDSTGTWEDPTRVADELAADDRWRELDSCAYTRVFQKVSA